MNNIDQANATAIAGASVSQTAGIVEGSHAHGVYKATCMEAKKGMEAIQAKLFWRIHRVRESRLLNWKPIRSFTRRWVDKKMALMLGMMTEAWSDIAPNLVTTVGGNFMLDNNFSASAYTATWYQFLISSISFTGYAVGDTMASHAGWLEAGGTNNPTYSAATRPAMAWGSASGKLKVATAINYTIVVAGTVKGCGMVTNNTKDGTTGTLYSAGNFTGGDQPVVATNVLTVTYTAGI